MPHLFILLLKINIVLILFAAAYYLILRKLTFYVINRIFLAFGILFSTIYPFIDLTDFLLRQQQISPKVEQLNQKVTALVPTNFITEHWGVISALFFVGVLLMAVRLIVQFVSLYKMHKKSKQGSVANYAVRILDEPVSPFSFWQTVYINPALHQENELQTILAHEHIHVKEWHSLDIIMAELSVVFYWFNPGVWLMKKAVKENLEFITDAKILKNGIDRKTYQYSLLDVGNLTPAVAIVNNFNLSDLKKRIQMMNLKRSSNLTLSRYLFVLPVLLVTTLAFTVSKKEIKKHLQPLQQVLVKANIIDAPKDDTIKITNLRFAKKKKPAVVLVVPKTDSSKYIVMVNTLLMSRDSAETTTENLPKVVNIVRGFPIDQAVLQELKGKVEGKVISISYNRSDSVSATSSDEKLKPVKGQFVGEANGATKRLQTVTVVGMGFKFRGSQDTTANNSKVSYILNGKEISAKDLGKINADEIKNVNVIKKDPALTEITIIGRKKVD